MTSAPSILFLNRVYSPGRGATGRILRDVAEAFAREGWHVHVLTTGDQAETRAQEGVQITCIKAPLNKQTAFAYGWVWFKLWLAALKMPPCDIVVTMTDPPMQILIGNAYARLKKARHIHWCQDLYPDLLPALGIRLPSFLMRYLRRLSRRAMKQADRIIVIGRCMARYLVQTGLNLSELTLITNWPDREILAPAKEAERMYDAQSRIFYDEKPRFRVLYAGSIGRSHPMKTIMDAVTRLNETHPDIEFMFVGDDKGHDRLARQRDRLGLSNIRMLPFQPPGRLRQMMESADAHLVSLNDEAAGQMVPSKFYSAIAAGRPCLYIGPPDTEISQVVDYFHCGLNIPNGDVQTLIRAILAFRDNADIWQEAHEGSIKARSVFLPDQSINAFIKRAVQLRQSR